MSVDPAPAAKTVSVAKLRERLLDTSLSLFERYRCVVCVFTMLMVICLELLSYLLGSRFIGRWCRVSIAVLIHFVAHS